ncbi:MAG: hypothetical protein HN919_16050 [Verrucomicrobia bacterium]|nr:hypothetical protein [Verrucomicrobiota bacterium]
MADGAAQSQYAWRWRVGLLLVLLAGFGLRMALAVTAFASTRDTSTVGIMAGQILNGSRPLFYAGQEYMGALEAYLVAIVFRCCGVSPVTLALIPSLMALLWAGALFALFRRLFASPAAGLAAAACASFGGHYTMWYTMGAYGGYPEMYLFGTLALLLAMMVSRSDAPEARWRHWLLLGGVLALGVWTNMQVIPFFLTAGLWIAVDWLRHRRRSWRRPAAMLTALSIGLLGLLPSRFVPHSENNELVGMVLPRLSLLARHGSTFARHNLPRALWWPDTHLVWIWCLGLLLLLPVTCYLAGLFTRRGEARRRVPLIFVALFLLLYLSHPLAALSAPRYLISFVTLSLAAGFAAMLVARPRLLRLAGLLLLLLWCGYNVSGTLNKCLTSRAAKAQELMIRHRLIDKAEQAGLQNVKIIGGIADCLRGLKLSFSAGGRVAFLGFRDDRILAHHTAWAADDRAGYAFSPRLRFYFEGAMTALAAESYTFVDDPNLMMLADIVPSHARRRAVDVASVITEGVSGRGIDLFDRVRSTALAPTGAVQQITFALEGVTTLSGMRFMPAGEDLPRGPYDLAVSTDGAHFTPILTNITRVGESYVNGNRIYLKDVEPAQDHCWSPVEASHVRFPCRSSGKAAGWAIAEAYLFEHVGELGPVGEAEVEAISRHCTSRAIDFAWCDRWLSRKLVGVATPPAPNSRYAQTLIPRRVDFRSGLAVIVDRAIAADTERTLTRALPTGRRVMREDFDHYSVFHTEGTSTATPAGDPDLVWNGHTVLLTPSP